MSAEFEPPTVDPDRIAAAASKFGVLAPEFRNLGEAVNSAGEARAARSDGAQPDASDLDDLLFEVDSDARLLAAREALDALTAKERRAVLFYYRGSERASVILALRVAIGRIDEMSEVELDCLLGVLAAVSAHCDAGEVAP